MKSVALLALIGAIIAATFLGRCSVAAQQPTPCEQCVSGFVAWTWLAYDQWNTTLCDGMPPGTDVSNALINYYDEICSIPTVTYYWTNLQWANNNCAADVPPSSSAVNVPMPCPAAPLDQYGNNPWMGLSPQVGVGASAWCTQAGFAC
jgi:hypothetical protein